MDDRLRIAIGSDEWKDLQANQLESGSLPELHLPDGSVVCQSHAASAQALRNAVDLKRPLFDRLLVVADRAVGRCDGPREQQVRSLPIRPNEGGARRRGRCIRPRSVSTEPPVACDLWSEFDRLLAVNRLEKAPNGRGLGPGVSL